MIDLAPPTPNTSNESLQIRGRYEAGHPRFSRSAYPWTRSVDDHVLNSSSMGPVQHDVTLNHHDQIPYSKFLDLDDSVKSKRNAVRRSYSDVYVSKKNIHLQTIIRLDDYNDEDFRVSKQRSQDQKAREVVPTNPPPAVRPAPRRLVRRRPDEEISWHRMAQQSAWSEWYDCLLKWQRRLRKGSTDFPDEMILDADTNTTILHVAAWKAPPVVMLLLLEVMTTGMNPTDRYASLTRTRQCLLCGDTNGNTPLHLACANLEANHDVFSLGTKAHPSASATRDAVDFAVIKNLLVLGKEAFEMQNHAGDTPLHLLLASDAFRRKERHGITSGTVDTTEAATEEAIASLLSMAGDLAVTRNDAGLTPLHVAIANSCYESVILRLIQVAENAMVTMTDSEDMLPLHYATAFGATSTLVAQELIAACPDSVSCQTVYGDTPLHLLVTNAKASSREIDDSVSTTGGCSGGFLINPQTVELAQLCLGTGDEDMPPILVQNRDGMTPLHCCAMFHTPVELTCLLLDSNLTWTYGRIASALHCASGSTALHVAIEGLRSSGKLKYQKDASWYRNAEAAITALATPEACATFDVKDRTPLMLAVQSSKVSPALIRILIRAFPKSVTVTTSKGYLPIHLACQNRKIKVSILKLLIRAYPSGVSSVNDRGNTPLAEAAKYRISYAAVELLIAEYPDALHLRNAKGERPLDRAIANGATSAFVTLLEKATNGGQLSLLSALRVTKAIRYPPHPGDAYRSRKSR